MAKKEKEPILPPVTEWGPDWKVFLVGVIAVIGLVLSMGYGVSELRITPTKK